MSRRRIVLLGVPLAVLVFALGFIVGLEVQRGPDWRLELEAYVAQQPPSEAITVQRVVRAHRPRAFSPTMGRARPTEGLTPSGPARAVRCALLERRRPSSGGGEPETVRQVVFLVRHSDALYRVGWLAYTGPEEPFAEGLEADLARLGCDLGLR
jgi:hypothetical protein